MDNKQFIIVISIIIALIFGVAGFFIGRSTINTEPKVIVKYIKGETIRDSIPYPLPYYIEKPADTLSIIKQCVKDSIYSELFPEKIITEYIEITKEDTTAIMMDWATKRMYSDTLFNNDTTGTCIVDATVQYNRMSLLSYQFTPIQKTVTITNYKTKMFSPYIGAGILIDNDFKDYKNIMPTANIGFFIKERYGLNLQYAKSFKTKNNFYGVSLLYKF